MGIHAMLMLWAREGDTVLLPRNAHLSAANACILGGLNAVWMPVTQLPDGYCYVAEETVLEALSAHPDAKAVLVTRPDYFGCGIPLRRIVEEAHRLGIRLVVDEAHGAHLPWQRTLTSAGEDGADAWVQSVHKTLPGLTGSAVLNLRHAEDAPVALRIIRREQTSSPSFILMRSIDDSRAWMEHQGAERLCRLTKAVERLRDRLPELGYRDAREAWRQAGLQADPSRLVIDAPQGGHELAEALAGKGIDAEMADDRRTVLLFSAMNSPEDVLAVERALCEIRPYPAHLRMLPDISALPQRVMSLRQAAMADTEPVPLNQAAGRVTAVSVGLYPPGVPQTVPGERLTDEVIHMLTSVGAQGRFGVEGESILCVKQ